ncbi:MATE family efflux transporter [Paralimibaculum aggregatum]|uniref:MATE family efflux transporter n=1 Tax=Paralimibaculum aggregatum TaxID=3036245 RepID=A0ABQ6LRV2_9RHOB|nr:MATE family efflux transporter [Limibaculum sp. NKW23]GMG84085.1 MATE family efflux transporter [Limibaculum sp. NKW23]
MTAAAGPAPAERGAITHRRVAAIALPVVLSNATVPLQGAIDTAIVGNLGETAFLAAVAIGAVIVSLLFNSFNFLQMGCSGLTAQALGAGDFGRVLNTGLRALLLAAAIALLLNLARPLILPAGLAIFEGSAEAERLAGAYVSIRLWGAPAELANLALIGWFTGQELTRRLFELQAVVSVVNVALNFLFAVGLGWGVEGIALGTALAAYAGLAVGLWRLRRRAREIAPAGWRPDPARLARRDELARMVALNRDIFIRTICLTGSFAWLARLGSTQGDAVLSANGVLMQFVNIAAHALDGFAMAAETLVGQALGAGDRARLRRAVVVSGTAALGLAALYAAVATLGAESIIGLFTNVPEVREVALAHAFWATCLPLVAVLAYQLDGVFIGAAEGPGMRNAMLISTLAFVPLGWGLTAALGNHGLWLALWIYMAMRALTLALRYPALEMRAEGVHLSP